jgi:hypothetical protein
MRIVRNTTSHGTHTVLGRWDDELNKRGITTASWRHRTLSTHDVGQMIKFNEFDAWKLHLDVLDFVRTSLP